MSIFERHPKQIPEVGDVIEGRARMFGDWLHWSHTGNFVYGVVTATNPMKVHTYGGPKEVRGPFIGKVEVDNSDIMDRYGTARIWLVLPLGRTEFGHLVNLPKTGFSVEVHR